MPRSKSLAELERERGRLLERIAIQRQQLSAQMMPVENLLNFGDRVAHTIRSARNFVAQHPWATGALGALVVMRRPRSMGRWLKRGLFAWRTWRTARNLLQVVQRQLDQMAR